jgi:hypothetical protein
MSKLITPRELSRQALVEIVSGVQALLYLDVKGEREFWNPAKEWSGADVCFAVQDLLHQHGLVPGDEESCDGGPRPDVRQLVDWAKSHGLQPDDLDDAVHDNAAALASGINNGGLAEQIEFLVDQQGVPETQALLTGIASGRTSH